MMVWPRSLSTRLALALLALLLLVGAFSLTLSTSMTYRALEEARQSLNRDLAKRLAAIQPLLVDGDVNREATEHLFHTLMEINPAIEVYLLDAAGNILAVSAPPEVVKKNSVDPAPIRAFLDGRSELPIRGDDPRNPHRPAVFSAAAVPGIEGTDAYLYVILGGDMYQSALSMVRENTIVRQGAWLLAASLVVAAIAGALLFRFLTRRLRRLAAEMDRAPSAQDSEMPTALPATGDEIGILEQNFVALQTRIELQLQELRRLDTHRRKLVANVSHDLRTPLAALTGYLETLQMGENRLAEEQRHEYVGLALRHAERLGALIGDLFELARLDAGEPLDLEPASVGELVQDNVQKFQLSAERAGISLVAEVRPGLPQIRVDIHLLDRLLENLITNALRHTPTMGEVRVTVSDHDGGVRVAVTDSGPGIRDADLNRVFDRFQRGSDNDNGGAGLGLAIAKRIVELHGGTIRAENRRQGGGRLLFELPLEDSSTRAG